LSLEAIVLLEAGMHWLDYDFEIERKISPTESGLDIYDDAQSRQE
jgi:hypothetical protein